MVDNKKPRKSRKIFGKRQKQNDKNLTKKNIDKLLSGDHSEVAISPNIDVNINNLQTIYENCSDIIFHNFLVASNKATIIYIEGLADTEKINDDVLKPLLNLQKNSDLKNDWTMFINHRVPSSDIKQIEDTNNLINEVSMGKPVLLIDGVNVALSFGLQKWEQRSIEEPIAEAVIQGPREGFIETLRVNTSLIRRKIRSPKLKIKTMIVGKYTGTTVAITYIDGLANDTLIQEVENRLKRVKIDGILESGYIEEFIEDQPFSPFPTVLHTERPDTVCGNLLEGRVAILVDGTPFATVVPITLYSLLQTEEDYYQRFLVSTAIRWLRYIFLVFGLLLPSVYVAVITFHQEMVPTTLLISMAASRESVPFPAFVEALIMEITFEALREAGLRLPKQVGSAVSIVGALVIGDAAVSAGIVSAPMVIVVAITGIASFAIPRYNVAIAIRLLRFPMIFLAGFLGLLGIMFGVILIVVHLSSLRSFGVPYLSPMAPMKFSDMKDVLMRGPWWSLNKRPHFTGEFNQSRQQTNQKPSPKKGTD